MEILALAVKIIDDPPKILGRKVPEIFYLLPLHSSLFTKNAPENFEVIGNSEELKSENYIGSDSSQVSPPKKSKSLEHHSKEQFSRIRHISKEVCRIFAFMSTNAVLVRKIDKV